MTLHSECIYGDFSNDQELRLKVGWDLVKQGYQPIPILARDKMPFISNWQIGEMTGERIVELVLKYGNHTSFGLRCGELVPIDIDLHDEFHTQIIEALVFDRLGVSRLRRRGSKGVMPFYRMDGPPIGKVILKTPKTETENPKTLVEIFGERTQVAVYGVHPTTKKPYQWLEAGYEPLLTPFSELLPVTATQLGELRTDLVRGLEYLGYQVESSQIKVTDNPPEPVTGLDGARDVTEMFLRLVTSRPYKRTHSGWFHFQCPACRRDDNRAGLAVSDDGGVLFKCFHAACTYFKMTRWSPDQPPGQRIKTLYGLLGGDESDLTLQKRNEAKLRDRFGKDARETIAMINDPTKFYTNTVTP